MWIRSDFYFIILCTYWPVFHPIACVLAFSLYCSNLELVTHAQTGDFHRRGDEYRVTKAMQPSHPEMPNEERERQWI